MIQALSLVCFPPRHVACWNQRWAAPHVQRSQLFHERSHKDMRCEEIMKQDVECVSPQDSVQMAAKRMRDENVGFLPVCGPGQKVMGTVTDRDLACRVLALGLSPSTPISDV